MTRLFCLFLLVAGTSSAQAQDGLAGKRIYDRYCAACHGSEGAGQGPMQRVLDLPPSDLTRLRRANDGRFPLARVVGRIDGRDPVEAHAGEMPVYGDIFEGRSVPLGIDEGDAVRGSPEMADLVAYLRSLQN